MHSNPWYYGNLCSPVVPSIPEVPHSSYKVHKLTQGDTYTGSTNLIGIAPTLNRTEPLRYFLVIVFFGGSCRNFRKNPALIPGNCRAPKREANKRRTGEVLFDLGVRTCL